MTIKRDLTNKRVGSLLVIKPDYYIGNKLYWLCKCDCGKTKSVRYDCLTRELTKSCGCLCLITGKDHPFWNGHGDISSSFFTGIKNGAKSRNLEFNITIEEIWDLFIKQNKKCYFSGLDLTFSKNSKDRSDGNASLDRIDNNKGYVNGNVQWVHKIFNIMKNDLEQSVLIDWCIKVSDYNSNKNEYSLEDKNNIEYLNKFNANFLWKKIK